ncbi:MAG: cytochrome P450 [Myxococcota bacterium]
MSDSSGDGGPEREPMSMFSPEFAANPQPVYREIVERKCPVAHNPISGDPMITRYEDVLYALRTPEIFSSEMEMQMNLGTVRPMIPQQIDPPLQTKFRKILDPYFSRKQMETIAPDVRRHAHELIDAFVDDGEVEFNSAFAIPLPCSAFLRLMGLPLDRLEEFLEIKDGIIRPGSMDPDEASKIRSASGQRIYEIFEAEVARRQADPGDDLVTHLVGSELDGRPLTVEEVLDVCFLMLLAGLDTVTSTIGCNVAYLAQHPDQRDALVADPAKIPAAVEELLRWETPVTAVPRLVKKGCTLSGVDLVEGQMVALLIGASDVDDREFGNAMEVDLERERNRHLAFGGGHHRCLGSHLARMELRVAMEVLNERIPDYRIKPGETPRYSPGIREVQYLPLVWDTRSA